MFIEMWRSFPLLAQGGLTVIVAGTVADLTAHGAALAAGPQHLAHGAILAGMVMVLIGVVADGVSHPREPGDLGDPRDPGTSRI
jgi:hypothetical protein